MFTLFNKINAKDIYLRVRGYEHCADHHAAALKYYRKKHLQSAESRRASGRNQSGVSELAANSSFNRGNTNLVDVYSNAAKSKQSAQGSGIFKRSGTKQQM